MKLAEFIQLNVNLELVKIEDRELVQEIQFKLNNTGYFLLVDGIVGAKTLAAYARWKKDNYLSDPHLIGRSSAKILSEASEILSSFFKPTKGVGWISSQFGRRSRGYHKGIDIACNTGTPIFAVAAGRIKTLMDGCQNGNYSCGGGYGNCVYLAHSDLPFDETRYAHLDRLAFGLYQNQIIGKGELLGYCGNTGHSFGSHLHFETRLRGNAFNPLSAINPIV